MPEWIYPIIAGALIALIGVVWTQLKSSIAIIWDQIGRDSQSGMRKKVHDTAGTVHGHGLEIGELQRRVETLERRVFNGHRESER